MPVPAFTEHGLLPEGVHACSMPEARDFLCFNEHREGIWGGFVNFVNWIAQLPAPDALLIDGSYVTDKALPGDVDVVIDVTGCQPAEQEQWMQQWATQHGTAREQFGVDFYPFVVGHGNDFSAFFQYVRVDEALRRGIPPSVRKGILRVQP